ncbi:MAG: UDP-N-acetylmuramoyl-L-alanyl-D-glutamate--2,6-diaminopimelate ligase [Acutalibacteraceae bacterium]|nr:UDP-N-acetylmuramoyl-L-alanyl-D-glutamate--2,6-diaminopimelate ligase [Acutalibacteraceae bacterium]
MLISRLLKAIDKEYKEKDADIKFITDDSRKCEKDCVFVCTEKGNDYVKEALKNGAALVIAQEKLCESCIVVPDARKAYAILSAAFFGFCHKRLRLIGVTGTNGKTTVCEMLYSMMTAEGKVCGLTSTVRNITSDSQQDAEFTTPDPFTLHKLFYELCQSGAEYCIVECSSQGLSQMRLYGLEFEMGIFTNFSQDHLDYHKNEESYLEAKKILFAQCKTGIINLDDARAGDFISSCKGKVYTYSVKKDEADFTAKAINSGAEGSDYAFVGDSIIHRIKLKMPGLFNISNSMAALSCAVKLGFSLDGCAAGLRNFYGVRGRMEILPVNKEYEVIIDYAHTPDGLRQLLLAVSSFRRGRIITVFGCGGDRDKEKRSIMGKTVCEFSDLVVVTSDNPRSEDPQDIIDDILEGTKNSSTPVYIHKNRTKAIEYALKNARKNDIILLCGKGHENYQLVGNEKIPYDEREIVLELLK